MPRRAGKAASRRARQRAAQRQRPSAAPGPRQPTPLPSPAQSPSQLESVPPVGTPDARAAESLDPPRRVTRTPATTVGSRLTTSEVAEYHYVERDLRNIGILTAALFVLLLVAWAVFQALGLTT